MKGHDRSCVCEQSEMRIETKLLLGGAWGRPHLLLELMHIIPPWLLIKWWSLSARHAFLDLVWYPANHVPPLPAVAC